ncbi:MAG TPA: Bax inhibitor-1/YccA family protein [Kineosporiaceae bacterium]|nr:Bax inhibitor-1/YccA family protein [Kineosporiaceae bacterium]
MESRNPVFNNNREFQRGGYATFETPTASDLQGMYDAPAATARQTGRMTLDDVVVRTAGIFAVLLAAAGVTYFVLKPGPGIVIGSAIAALALGLVTSFSRTVRPALILLYGLLEGVFVGGISYWYAQAFGNQIVPQAVLGTLVAFGTMLALYKARIVRNSPRFTKILLIAGVSYLVFGLINLIVYVASGHSVYTSGPLGVLVSGFGVVLASLYLVLDFDFVEQGIRNGLPERYAWIAAFGLVVTLVWLYLEVLRLLAILQSNR